jgi:xanthine dehydrogenase accessory factor
MEAYHDVIEEVAAARARGEAFALATVVRTVSLTAAKAGAKAIVRADGTISAGWIGGGCARGAVLKAAREALADGSPRLISVQPPEALRAIGHEPGEHSDGTLYARNMCASQGTMDIFVEPYPAQVELLICGATPLARALADLGGRMGLRVVVAADPADHRHFTSAQELLAGFDISPRPPLAERYTVVATQGRGDQAALFGALSVPSHYVAFVGSRRKVMSLKDELIGKGIDRKRLDELHAPAGLDLGAATPEEIAISILGEIITVRRRNKKQADAGQSVTSPAAE